MGLIHHYFIILQQKEDYMNAFSKLLLLMGCGWWSMATLSAQPRYRLPEMQTERLGRGVVAWRSGDSVIVGWRSLREDAPGTTFDVYRDGVRLNTVPLTGATRFVDRQPPQPQRTGGIVKARKAVYEVRGGSRDGAFTWSSAMPDGYLRIPLRKPVNPDTAVYGRDWRGRAFTYMANDASIGDLDGDGEYEIVLKWEPTNARDNSQGGLTAPTLLDGYRLDGTLLWRIDLGRNIRSGAHYVPFLVYDFDGDGRAELMVKTADGTRDGQGTIIGDSTASWTITADNPDRRLTGRQLDGPEYLSVFDGLTGRVLATTGYVPRRGRVADWGDNYGNRSERYLAAVAYLDGRRPSAVFCRGYYTRSVLAAWDWDGHTLQSRWVFDSDRLDTHATRKDDKQNTLDYETHRYWGGQGNHNLRTGDVDGDGCDEITYGAMAIDHDGHGLYTTGFGHGDALHQGLMVPGSDSLYIWDCHENRRDGCELRNAATGRVVFQKKATWDVGRCMAADIDPRHPGWELWSGCTDGVTDWRGQPLGYHVPTENSAIFWDGDTLRELLDHRRVMKFNWTTEATDTLAILPGEFNNGTKSNPCLSADILGDWREEVLVRDPESTELRLCLSPHATPWRVACLEQDIIYRESVAAENVGYNQPPEMGRPVRPCKP